MDKQSVSTVQSAQSRNAKRRNNRKKQTMQSTVRVLSVTVSASSTRPDLSLQAKTEIKEQPIKEQPLKDKPLKSLTKSGDSKSHSYSPVSVAPSLVLDFVSDLVLKTPAPPTAEDMGAMESIESGIQGLSIAVSKEMLDEKKRPTPLVLPDDDEETKDAIVLLPPPKVVISLGAQVMLNGNAIMRYFSSAKMEYDVPVIESNTTYWGMWEVLCNLSKRLTSQGLAPEDFCVLCPRYALTGRKGFPGGDTQAGGGGKTAKYWDDRQQRYLYEAFSQAAREEVIEELRVIGGTPCLESEIETTDYSRSERRSFSVFSKMYSFKVSECKAPPHYNASYYARKGRRGEDVYTEKVGFIPWGTLDECVSLVQAIPVDVPVGKSKSPLVDGIDAVSIVSLPKAIQMASSASRNLRGTVVSSRYM